jgi:hypothetical protein
MDEGLRGFELVESAKTMDILVIMKLCLCDVLCFAVFMEWAALGVDQTGVLCCLWTGCAMEDNGWHV